MEFAKQNGLALSTLNYWLAPARSASKALVPQFAETGVKRMASVSPLEIEEKRALDSCTPVLPEMILSDQTTLDLGEHRIEIFHPGPAHTSGDLVVWSPQERVLATGGLFLRTISPASP